MGFDPLDVSVPVPLSPLLLACIAWLIAPAAAAPDTEAANRAMAEALRCTVSRDPVPDAACDALAAASAERVRFPSEEPTPGNLFKPWVELRRSDGSWRRLVEEDIHAHFHGMLWVPEAGLYVGYASWYGEQGGTILAHPDGDGRVVASGIPVLSPDGALLVAAEVDVFSDGQLRLQAFTTASRGPHKVVDLTLSDVDAERVAQVDYVPELGAVLLAIVDWEGHSTTVSVDLTEHWPAEPTHLLSVEDCEKSETARYVRGDQVYLRSGPSQGARVRAALPWGSCVQGTDLPGPWTLVRIADQSGFVADRLLSQAAPARSAVPADFPRPDHLCHGVGGFSDGSPAMRAARRANVAAGLEPDGYYAVPAYDMSCESLRGAAPNGANVSLGALERTASPHLNLRFASWTLALAPENAYRTHSASSLLNASPLFRPFPGASAPNDAIVVGTSEESPTFRALFEAPELRASAPPPPEVHLLHVRPDGDRLVFRPWRAHEGLGVAQGSFPAGSFRLSDDKTEARFDRDLRAAVFDPCAEAFRPVVVRDVAYVLSAGQLQGTLDPDTQRALNRCQEDLAGTSDSPARFRFLLLVDETEGAVALASLASPPSKRATAWGDPEPGQPSYRWGAPDGGRGWRGGYPDAAALRWDEDGEDRARLYLASWWDCGTSHAAVFVYHDEGWRRVQSQVHDFTVCGA